MFKENAVVLSFPRIDSGNVAANAAALVVPCRMVLDKLVAGVSNPLANSATVRCDSFVNNTRTNNAVGSVVLPDAAVPGKSYYNITNARGLVLDAGTVLSVEVTEAGDSGEFILVSILGEYAPEIEANETSTLVAG